MDTFTIVVAVVSFVALVVAGLVVAAWRRNAEQDTSVERWEAMTSTVHNVIVPPDAVAEITTLSVFCWGDETTFHVVDGPAIVRGLSLADEEQFAAYDAAYASQITPPASGDLLEIGNVYGRHNGVTYRLLAVVE